MTVKQQDFQDLIDYSLIENLISLERCEIRDAMLKDGVRQVYLGERNADKSWLTEEEFVESWRLLSHPQGFHALQYGTLIENVHDHSQCHVDTVLREFTDSDGTSPARVWLKECEIWITEEDFFRDWKFLSQPPLSEYVEPSPLLKELYDIMTY